MSMPPAGGIAVPIPAGRRVCNRGGQWRYVERQKRAAIIARHASAPARLGHKLASTKNWKAMAAPNSAVTVTACSGVGTQCAAACSGLGRLRPGPGRAGLHQTRSRPRRRTGYPPPPRPWAPAPLPWPSAAGCPPGSGWAWNRVSLGSVVRLRLRLRRQVRVRVRACRLLVLHTNDACCSTQPCGCGQRARSRST